MTFFHPNHSIMQTETMDNIIDRDKLQEDMINRIIDGMDIDGTYVTSSSLDALPSGELTSIVGNDVIDELRGEDKLDVLASLPTPIRKEIIDLM